jgi:hypothetical protein
MTGAQVANNLAHSKEKWTTGSFYDGDGAFCVLGLKANEVGVEKGLLEALSDSNADLDELVAGLSDLIGEGLPEKPDYDDFDNLDRLVRLNDDADDKASLIAQLRSKKYRRMVFDIESYRRALLKYQKDLKNLPDLVWTSLSKQLKHAISGN